MAEEIREEQPVVAAREERTMDENLQVLYNLQRVDSKIDHFRRLRGELPEEVRDLEDEIEGLRTRVANLEGELQGGLEQISSKRIEIRAIENQISKYVEQQKNVRNNREYDSLTNELEYQRLEVDLRNKQIRDIKTRNEGVSRQLEMAKRHIAERELDLGVKRSELQGIIDETEKEEAELRAESETLQSKLPERVLQGYLRIRNSVRNGLAVVSVKRNACGGCFNRIPPQRLLDIRMQKRIIVCEYCGRILVWDEHAEDEE